MGWHQLPNELLVQIFTQLELREVRHIAAVCSQWRHVAVQFFWWPQVEALAKSDFSVKQRLFALTESGDPDSRLRTFCECFGRARSLWSEPRHVKHHIAPLFNHEPAEGFLNYQMEMFSYQDQLILVLGSAQIEIWDHVKLERSQVIVERSLERSKLEVNIHRHLLVIFNRSAALIRIFDLEQFMFVFERTIESRFLALNEGGLVCTNTIGLNDRHVIFVQPHGSLVILEHGLIYQLQYPTNSEPLLDATPGLDVNSGPCGLQMNDQFVVVDTWRTLEPFPFVRQYDSSSYSNSKAPAWIQFRLPAVPHVNKLVDSKLSNSHLIATVNIDSTDGDDSTQTKLRIFNLRNRQCVYCGETSSPLLGAQKAPIQWLQNDTQLAFLLVPSDIAMKSDSLLFTTMTILDLKSSQFWTLGDAFLTEETYPKVMVHSFFLTHHRVKLVTNPKQDEGLRFEMYLESKSFWPNIE